MNESINNTIKDAAPEFDTEIVPVMREAVAMVQMILFQRLRENIRLRYQDWPEQERTRLAGAAVNNLYGTDPADQQVNSFAREHRQLIEEELRGLHSSVADLVPHITDSLRMQTICDNHEGIHSIPCLLLAKELGILDEERVLPMPSTFMLSVRKLGAECGLIKAQAMEAEQRSVSADMERE
jgi:hypothetical protein